MLTANQFDGLTADILELYDRYQQSVINDIARRIAGLDYATSSAAWQMQRLNHSGALYDSILEKLSDLTGRSERELKAMFTKAGVKAMAFDDSIYRAAGLQPLPLNLSPAMGQVLAAGLRKTGDQMKNLCLTTASTGQELFVQATDLAYMQVTGGAMSYQQAVRGAVRDIAARGLSVINYASGRRDQLDVATRRAVLTGVAQTTGNLQWARADEMGQDLVQTSAHAGARPAHMLWQGKIFSRSGTSKDYPDFRQATGYGTGAGLMGYNCRHSYYPFFEGISENAYDRATLDEFISRKVKYNGEEMPFYDATQQQRGIERKIRLLKRQKSAMEAAGLDSTPEGEAIAYYQAKMRDFTKQTGLVRQRSRELVPGV